MNPFLTVNEVAEIEGISARRVRLLCEQGRVHHCVKTDGGMWLIQRGYMIRRNKVGRPPKFDPANPFRHSASKRK